MLSHAGMSVAKVQVTSADRYRTTAARGVNIMALFETKKLLIGALFGLVIFVAGSNDVNAQSRRDIERERQRIEREERRLDRQRGRNRQSGEIGRASGRERGRVVTGVAECSVRAPR